VYVCIPTEQKNFQKLSSVINLDYIERWLHDTRISWPIVIAVCVSALILGFIFFYMIEWMGMCLVVVSVVATISCFGLLGYYSFQEYRQTKSGEVFQFAERTFSNKKAILFWVTFGSWALAIICLLIWCCYWTKIKVSIGIMQVASKFINSIKRILILPIGLFVTFIIFLIFWITSVL